LLRCCKVPAWTSNKAALNDDGRLPATGTVMTRKCWMQFCG
jgi:hypothetical protein